MTDPELVTHLKEKHGYGVLDTATVHPTVLRAEHDRIHQKLATNHTHKADQ